MADRDDNQREGAQDDAATTDRALEASSDSTILVYQSPVTRIRDTEGLLELAREQHAFDPSVFEESPPFFWRTIPSTQQVDTYGTRMMDDSLRNFADDATNGVSFQSSHNIRELPIGRSVRGQFFNARSDPGKHTKADFYTIPGLKLSSVPTDDFIRGVRAGIIHDVSIGFYGGEIRCSVCGEPWWSFFGYTMNDCEHMPGIVYPKLDKRGEPTDEMVMATGDVYGAHMAECSAVYDGATPGSAVIGIVRAERMVDAGRVTPDTARLLEARYRIKLPSAHHAWPGADLSRAAELRAQSRHGAATNQPEDHGMGNRSSAGGAADATEQRPPNETAQDTNRAAADTNASAQDNNSTAVELERQRTLSEAEQRGRSAGLQSARTLLVDAGLIPADSTVDLPSAVRSLQEQHTHLVSEAQDGRTYRADLIDDALREGVRALGNDFRPDDYRSVLEAAPLATIKRFRDDWKAAADRMLTGGRRTTDAPTEGEQNGTVLEYRPPMSVHLG